jgi:hypothetical protein
VFKAFVSGTSIVFADALYKPSINSTCRRSAPTASSRTRFSQGRLKADERARPVVGTVVGLVSCGSGEGRARLARRRGSSSRRLGTKVRDDGSKFRVLLKLPASRREPDPSLFSILAGSP